MKAIGLLLLLVTCVAAASDVRLVHVSKEIDFAIPAKSPVTSWKLKKYDTVEYKGQFVVSGTYEYGWLTDDPSDEDNYGFKSLTFLADPESAKLFPYWTRDKVARPELEIRNPTAFARSIISNKQLKLLNSRKINSISGNTTIWVRALRTTVECDHQINSAEFVSPMAMKTVVSTNFAESAGC